MALASYMKNPSPSPGRKLKYSGESVRALPVRILTVGKKRSKGIQLLVDEYMEKLHYYCTIDDVQIKSNPKNTGDVKAQIESEDNIVMQHIRAQDWVVVLDEHGVDIGSEQMADLVGDAGKTGSLALAFCIGGPYGHGIRLRERADVTIKLSSMVFNHQIALVVLLEQLYSFQSMDNSQRTEISSLAGVINQFGQPSQCPKVSGDASSYHGSDQDRILLFFLHEELLV